MSRLFSGTQFDQPRICETCKRPTENCICAKNVILPEKKKMSERPGGRHENRPAKNSYQLTPQNSDPPKDQIAKLRIERRKGNREVTLITGLEHPANDLPALLARLKTNLGCGGAVQSRTIELQGDQAQRASDFLAEAGIKNRILK